ncbi:hypothetical protein GZ77_19025 [Endozoicomonas montiporae]|uniref:Uncharacterized protein n=1 Tax=Endozoicomonas montiporae TaxID=1027273 RepID=A0A081N2C5_9GAMM|nr:hypothetical protein GZ77_19025 [Endozoicomonas montiporae]
MDSTTESIFQNDMIARLQAKGWLLGSGDQYDRETALYTRDVLDFVKNTQPKEWQKFCKSFPVDSATEPCWTTSFRTPSTSLNTPTVWWGASTIKKATAPSRRSWHRLWKAHSRLLSSPFKPSPYVLAAIENSTSLKERRYAVIADEAHSSQTGSTARKLKEVLMVDASDKSAEDGDEDKPLSSEDVLDAALSRTSAARKGSSNLNYYAFTATPKEKTLQLFGRLPNPNEPASDKNLPEAFHVYSMRQAIEEGVHSRCAEKLHQLQSGVSTGTEDRSRRRRGRQQESQSKTEPLGAAPRAQYFPEGPGHRRAL